MNVISSEIVSDIIQRDGRRSIEAEFVGDDGSRNHQFYLVSANYDIFARINADADAIEEAINNPPPPPPETFTEEEVKAAVEKIAGKATADAVAEELKATAGVGAAEEVIP